jgi:hypothetical protein
MGKILTEKVIKQISDNNDLISAIANVLDVSLLSMPMILLRKSRRLTEGPVLKVIADFLKCDMDDLLIDDSKVEAEQHTKNTAKKVVP